MTQFENKTQVETTREQRQQPDGVPAVALSFGWGGRGEKLN